MNSIFKMQLKVFSLPQAQLFDTNIYLTLLDVTANIWHTYFVVTLSTGGHKHTNFMAVERWIDYNSTHYGIMRRGQKVWGDMRTDGLVDERKYCMMTTKWYEHMLFFGRGGVVNPPLTNSDWSVRSTSMFPGKEGLGGSGGVCMADFYYKCCWHWLDRWCSNSPLVVKQCPMQISRHWDESIHI